MEMTEKRNERVFGSAKVYGEAQVFGSAKVYDEAQVYHSAWVYGSAKVYDSAQVYDSAKVYDSALVYDSAQVYGEAQVYDLAQARVAELEQWKRDALIVLDRWEEVRPLVPGRAGESLAKLTATELRRLQALEAQVVGRAKGTSQ